MAYLDLTGLEYFKDELVSDTLSQSGRAADAKAAGEAIYDSLPTDTASGSIASFPDGADSVPVEALTVSLEPVQDLHGQASPYPSGGGKNKCSLPDTTFVQFYEVEINEVPAGTYIFSAVVTSTDTDANECAIVFLDADKNTIVAKSITRSVNSGRTATTSFTASVPIKYLRLYASAGYPSGAGDTATFKDNMIESGTTATTYAPYSNLCPITGHDAVEVWDDPVYGGTIEWNQLVFDSYDTMANFEGASTTYDSETHKFCIENLSRTALYNSGSSRGAVTSIAPVYGHKYIVLSDTDESGIAVGAYTTQNQYKNIWNANTLFTLNISADNYSYFGLRITNQYDFVTKHPVGNKFYFTLNLFDLTEIFGAGNEPTTVEAFLALFPNDYYEYNTGEETCVSAVNGTEYRHIEIPLGQTVYGATLDVKNGVLKVLGELEKFDTVDARGYLMSNVNYMTPNTTVTVLGNVARINFNINIDVDQSKYNRISSSYSTKMCNMLEHTFSYASDTAHWYRNTVLYAFFPTSLVGTTTQSVINYLTSIKDTTPLTFWLPYNEPVEIPLTPNELTTLIGQNNVWSDSGDVAVEYRADIQKYIAKVISEALA